MRSPSVRNASAAAVTSGTSQRFPPSRRLRKRAEFQRVYEQGARVSGALLVGFCRRSGESGLARVGLSVPRRIGNAVVRNRVKRRLREAVRRHWSELPGGWDVVLHARGPIVSVAWPKLEAEIVRVFRRVANSSPDNGSRRPRSGVA